MIPHLLLGKDNARALVFIGGWPDDYSSAWGPVYSALKDEYKILSLCFPDFQKDARPKPWGYSFEEIVDLMHIQIIDKLGDAPFTLFTHDWGSHVGLLYQNKYPKNVESMVVCDVLVTNQDQLLIHPYKAFLILYYTINFAFAYVLSQLFRMFGQVWYMGTLAMLMSFPFISTTPCENFRQVRDLAELGVHMTYPYYYMWRGILTGTIRRAALPSCPMLYMWGRKKNTHFHDDGVLETVKLTPGNKIASFNSGHWFIVYESEAVVKAVKMFISK